MASTSSNNGIPAATTTTTTTQGQELADFYGAETAKFYAEIMSDEIEKVVPDLEILLQHCNKKNDCRILDTCVGSGHMIQWIRQNAAAPSASWQFKGVDLSPDMLEQAKQLLLVPDSNNNVELVLGNMLDLKGEQDDSYDAVLNTFALHHATPSQCQDAIQEWTRILKPGGGCLYIAIWEGTAGRMDYGKDYKDFEALLHSENDLLRWIDAAKELDIVHQRTAMEHDMKMNTMYVIAKKKAKRL